MTPPEIRRSCTDEATPTVTTLKEVEVALIFRVYSLVFWIPSVASAALLMLSWGELRRPLLHLVWFAAALLLQAGSGMFSPVWVAGLLPQTGLATYLAIRWKVA